jgi:hypothetical protein
VRQLRHSSTVRHTYISFVLLTAIHAWCQFTVKTWTSGSCVRNCVDHIPPSYKYYRSIHSTISIHHHTKVTPDSIISHYC